MSQDNQQPIDSKEGEIPKEISEWISKTSNDIWEKEGAIMEPGELADETAAALWRHFSWSLTFAESQIAQLEERLKTQMAAEKALVEKILELESRSVCRWVKASDRMPEDERRVVCIRGDGGGEYFYEAADTAGILEALKIANQGEIIYDIEWLEEIPAEQYSDQIAKPSLHAKNLQTQIGKMDTDIKSLRKEKAALISSNKEWGDKYAYACRERDMKAAEATDYRRALQDMADGLPLHGLPETAACLQRTLDQYSQPSKPTQQ